MDNYAKNKTAEADHNAETKDAFFALQDNVSVIEGYEIRFMPELEGLYIAQNLASREDDLNSLLFYFDPEPVILHNIPKYVRCITGKEGQYAAIYLNPERQEDGRGLLDLTEYVAVGESLDNVEEWKIILSSEEDSYETAIWYGDDLFLATKNKIVVIPDAMETSEKPKLLYNERPIYHDFPEFFILKNILYAYMQGKFYRYTKKGFFAKEGFNRKIYTIETRSVERVIPISDCEVAFIEHNQIPRTTDILMTEITILNVETGAVRKIPCPFGRLTSVEKGKLLVLCSRHDVVKDKSALPILVSIDTTTGEESNLPFGSFGRKEIQDVYMTRDGHVLLDTGEKIFCHKQKSKII